MNIEDILLPGYTFEGTSPISDTPPFPISTSLSDIPIPPVAERVVLWQPAKLWYSKPTSAARAVLLLYNSRPRYRISVSTNCFTPSSYITTIRKGSSESGELVGESEHSSWSTRIRMGLTSKLKPPTVCVRGQEALLHDILDDLGIFWKGQNGHLFWDDNSTTKKNPTLDLRDGDDGIPLLFYRLEKEVTMTYNFIRCSMRMGDWHASSFVIFLLL
ncbi:hypothetical protein IW262DRAFT_1297260 [Armillaria fumosa]|nr:hypothetical protein IW262DRAFT_1297260 [Armillaria fumosa]